MTAATKGTAHREGVESAREALEVLCELHHGLTDHPVDYAAMRQSLEEGGIDVEAAIKAGRELISRYSAPERAPQPDAFWVAEPWGDGIDDDGASYESPWWLIRHIEDDSLTWHVPFTQPQAESLARRLNAFAHPDDPR